MMFVHLHQQGNFINSFFWGLWLLPFGTLVIKSGLPRLLGVWLLANGAAYLAMSNLGLLFPSKLGLIDLVTQPALLGEVAITLWLLVKGARENPIANPL